MRVVLGVAVSFSLACAAMAAPLASPPPGVYRSAAQYHRGQPAPGGADATPSIKKHGIVVTQRQGSKNYGKVVVPFDSVWGYVNEKGVGYRIFRGEEYQIESTDTLAIYSDLAPNLTGADNPVRRTYATGQYYFSRGLNGLIFPLTEKNIRLAYEASNPTFVAAVQQLGVMKSLSDFDKKAGTFRVVKLYRDTPEK